MKHSMKGHLSFLLIWLISKNDMTGSQIADELEKRKGSRPSPGTIYPALKELKERGLIKYDKNKTYSLTSKGQRELIEGIRMFCSIFSDFNEMKSCCK